MITKQQLAAIKYSRTYKSTTWSISFVFFCCPVLVLTCSVQAIIVLAGLSQTHHLFIPLLSSDLCPYDSLLQVVWKGLLVTCFTAAYDLLLLLVVVGLGVRMKFFHSINFINCVNISSLSLSFPVQQQRVACTTCFGLSISVKQYKTQYVGQFISSPINT